MSANNRRIRRVIVDLLFEYGPLTKDEMATLLAKKKTIRAVPSPHSLSSLLSKNTQIIVVGTRKVETIVGTKNNYSLYDIDRELILCKDDLTYTRSNAVMTPSEKKKAIKCKMCGRLRVQPSKIGMCLECHRKTD